MTKDEALDLAQKILEKLQTPSRLNTSLDGYDIGRAITAIKAAREIKVEPVKVAHRHEWFRTGEMEVGQMRCISCGIWGKQEKTNE